MYKKKILLSSLIFVAPFFVKGISNGVKSKPAQQYVQQTEQEPEFVLSNDIKPLTMDCSYISYARARLEFKMDLQDALAPDLPYVDYSIVTDQDSCVKYIRPDNSGFMRKFGSLTWRNQNPGAMRMTPFARKMGAIGSAGSFAVFPNEEIGMAALRALLRSDAYANMTIYNAIHKYAPFCDSNDPVRYQNHLYAKTGIDTNRKIYDLSDDELDKIAETIKVLEGWKPGKQQALGYIADLLESFYSNKKQRNS